MSTKRAFTMVELIFVIVILGILAAVAVPKLNASRDDAEITKFAANLATVYKDVQTYYLAQGTAVTDQTRLSNIYADISRITNVSLTKDQIRFRNLQIGGKDCLDMAVYYNADGEFIRVKRTKMVDDENPLCAKMWETVQKKPELKALFAGQTSTNDLSIVNLADALTDGNRTIYRPLKGNEVEFD